MLARLVMIYILYKTPIARRIYAGTNKQATVQSLDESNAIPERSIHLSNLSRIIRHGFLVANVEILQWGMRDQLLLRATYRSEPTLPHVLHTALHELLFFLFHVLQPLCTVRPDLVL